MSGRKRACEPDAVPDVDISIALARAKRNFSYRLFEALSANKRGNERFLYWGKDGTSFLVDDAVFENQVMYVFPGLVATSSFKNFYRQLRVYGFDSLGSSCEGNQQFSHQYFQRGREDLLIHVQSTINKGARTRIKRPQFDSSSGMSSPSNFSQSHHSLFTGDLSCGDRAGGSGGSGGSGGAGGSGGGGSSGAIYYAAVGIPQLPDPMKLTSEVAVQTTISMETFARLDPRDISVSALMLPALVGFLDNCSEESKEKECIQFRQQIHQEFLSPPPREFISLSPTPRDFQPLSPAPTPLEFNPQQQQQQQLSVVPTVMLSPTLCHPRYSQATSTPVQTPLRSNNSLPPFQGMPFPVVTVLPDSSDPKSGARTLFKL